MTLRTFPFVWSALSFDIANEMQGGHVFALWMQIIWFNDYISAISVTLKNVHIEGRGHNFLLLKYIFSLSLWFPFCSNDKNLCSKALLSGVKAFSKADFAKEVEGNRSTILKYIHAQPAVPTPAEPEEKGQLLCPSFCFISSVFLIL